MSKTIKRQRPEKDEDDDMANELYYLRSAMSKNNGNNWITGRPLSEDDKLMIGIIKE